MRTTQSLSGGLSWLLLILTLNTTGAAAGGPGFTAVDHARSTIYHSPQTPGYTCWTGAWTMPNGDLMVSFTQATGPVNGRPKAPPEVMKRLSWYPQYDMTGLDLRNVHLRSADGGKTWKKVSEDRFKSPMNGVSGECEMALPSGTVLRGVFGFYLPYDPELPQTGYFQRSSDGTTSWGGPEVPLDPGQQTAWPRRLRLLRDGRLLALWGVARMPAKEITRTQFNKLVAPRMMVSADDGKTWSPLIEILPAEHRQNWGGEEFDAAELSNGDLLCVFRKGGEQVRWQGVLKKTGKTWKPGKVAPSVLPHSGQPELLATREGPILHVATSGVSWTTDAGTSWQKLNVPGAMYYPRSVQAKDGTVYFFGHVGGDNSYGSVDQAIVMDSFRLKKN